MRDLCHKLRFGGLQMESNMVKWSHWGTLGLIERGEMPRSNMLKTLQEFELEARRLLGETGAAHVVYGRKLFDEAGELKEIRFYLQPMDGKEFDRISLIQRQQVYAVHKI